MLAANRPEATGRRQVVTAAPQTARNASVSSSSSSFPARVDELYEIIAELHASEAGDRFLVTRKGSSARAGLLLDRIPTDALTPEDLVRPTRVGPSSDSEFGAHRQACTLRHPSHQGAGVDRLRRLRDVRHPNLLCVEDVTVEAPFVYILSEHIQGPSLKERVAQGSGDGLTEVAVWELVVQGARALSAIHALRAAHGGVDADELYFGPSVRARARSFRALTSRCHEWPDTRGDVKIGGLPRPLLNLAGAGTHALVRAPELAQATDHSPGADIWALGCAVYMAATGRHPFDGGSGVAQRRRVRRGQPAAMPSSCSVELRFLVRKMLDVDPLQRPTAEDMLRYAPARACARALAAAGRLIGPPASSLPATPSSRSKAIDSPDADRQSASELVGSGLADGSVATVAALEAPTPSREPRHRSSSSFGDAASTPGNLSRPATRRAQRGPTPAKPSAPGRLPSAQAVAVIGPVILPDTDEEEEGAHVPSPPRGVAPVHHLEELEALQRRNAALEAELAAQRAAIARRMLLESDTREAAREGVAALRDVRHALEARVQALRTHEKALDAELPSRSVFLEEARGRGDQGGGEASRHAASSASAPLAQGGGTSGALVEDAPPVDGGTTIARPPAVSASTHGVPWLNGGLDAPSPPRAKDRGVGAPARAIVTSPTPTAGVGNRAPGRGGLGPTRPRPVLAAGDGGVRSELSSGAPVHAVWRSTASSSARESAARALVQSQLAQSSSEGGGRRGRPSSGGASLRPGGASKGPHDALSPVRASASASAARPHGGVRSGRRADSSSRQGPAAHARYLERMDAEGARRSQQGANDRARRSGAAMHELRRLRTEWKALEDHRFAAS